MAGRLTQTFSQREGRPLVLAIGMFDGVHRGHQALLNKAVAEARAIRGEAAVLTFWPHPSVFFQVPEPTRLIFSPTLRAQRIFALGMDRIIQLPFEASLASRAAEDFPAWLKAQEPSLTKVFVGENWRFGKGRRGDARLLRELGPPAGFAVETLPRVTWQGEPISSSRIREALRQGDLTGANDLLGAPFEYEAEVVPGRRLGRTLGFPTLNLPWTGDLLPRPGVYAMEVLRGDGTSRPAVANLGFRPTVAEGDPEPLLEVHLLATGPAESLPGPGDLVHTTWRAFLRPEQRFANLAELKAQIARDTVEARKFFHL